MKRGGKEEAFCFIIACFFFGGGRGRVGTCTAKEIVKEIAPQTHFFFFFFLKFRQGVS